METKVKGVVRGAASAPVFAAGTEVPMQLSRHGDQYVALGLPGRSGLVMRGGSFSVLTSTAATPVVAIPTTAALLEIQNIDNERYLVVDAAFVVCIVITAAVQTHGILLCPGLRPKAAIAQTLTPTSLLAGSLRSNVAVAVGTTIAAGDGGVATNWFPFGNSVAPANTLQVGSTTFAEINGRIVLPPNFSVGMTIIAGTATASSVQLGMIFHMV